jgi:serine/threonine protein kinase
MSDSGQNALNIQSPERKRCALCFEEYRGSETQCPVDGGVLKSVIVDSLIGTTVDGTYEIVELISTGGFGSVYRAVQASLQRDVAIKVLHKHLLSDADTWRRFQREATAAATISHPNLAVVHAHGIMDSGNPYIVMQHFNGIDLADALRKGPMEPMRAVRLFAQVCDALHVLHKHGLIHRDIKPSNIMIVEANGKKKRSCSTSVWSAWPATRAAPS